MLNAERYKNEILEKSNVVFDFSISKDRHTIEKCLGVCDNCIFCNIGEHCSNGKVKWLLSEYKEPVKLTKFECDILEYALKNTDYRFITRDDEDKLYFYSAQNQRRLLSEDLFRFVQWKDSEPTEIEDVLNNFEVIENDL